MLLFILGFFSVYEDENENYYAERMSTAAPQPHYKFLLNEESENEDSTFHEETIKEKYNHSPVYTQTVQEKIETTSYDDYDFEEEYIPPPRPMFAMTEEPQYTPTPPPEFNEEL